MGGRCKVKAMGGHNIISAGRSSGRTIVLNRNETTLVLVLDAHVIISCTTSTLFLISGNPAYGQPAMTKCQLDLKWSRHCYHSHQCHIRKTSFFCSFFFVCVQPYGNQDSLRGDGGGHQPDALMTYTRSGEGVGSSLLGRKWKRSMSMSGDYRVRSK